MKKLKDICFGIVVLGFIALFVVVVMVVAVILSPLALFDSATRGMSLSPM